MQGFRGPQFLVLLVGLSYLNIPLAASFSIKEGDVMALSVVSLWSIVIPLLGLAIFIAALSCIVSRKPSATEAVSRKTLSTEIIPSTYATRPDRQSRPERVRRGHENVRKSPGGENQRVRTARSFTTACWACCTCGESAQQTDLSPVEAANIDDDEYEIVVEKLCVFKVPLSLVALPGETRVQRGATLDARSQVKVEAPDVMAQSSVVRDARAEPVSVGDVKNTLDTSRRPSSPSLGSNCSPDSERKGWNSVDDKHNVIPREVPESALPRANVPSLSPKSRQQQYQDRAPHEVTNNYMSLAGPSHMKDPVLYQNNFKTYFDYYRGKNSEFMTSPVKHPHRHSTSPRDKRIVSRDNSPVNEDSHQYKYGNVARVKKELSDYCRPPRMSLSGDNNAVSAENLEDPSQYNTNTNRPTYWTSECLGNTPFVTQKELLDKANAKVRDAKENDAEEDFYDYENYRRRNISPSQKRSLSPNAFDYETALHQKAKCKFAKLSPRQLQPDKYGVYLTPERKHSSSSFEVDESETQKHASESVSKMLYERITARLRNRSNVPLTTGEVLRVGVSRYGERRPASRKVTDRQFKQSDKMLRHEANSNQTGKMTQNELVAYDGRAGHFPVVDSSVEETLQNIIDLDVSRERINVQSRPFITEARNNEQFEEQKRKWNLYQMQKFKSQHTDNPHQNLRVQNMETKNVDMHNGNAFKGRYLNTIFGPSNLAADQDDSDLLLKIKSQLQLRKQKWPNSYEYEKVYSDEAEESDPDLGRIPSFSRHERSATLPREESRTNMSYHNQHFRSEPVMNTPVDIVHETPPQAKRSLRPKNVFSQRRLSLNDSDTVHYRFDPQEYVRNLQTNVTTQQVVNQVRPVAVERTLNWTFQIKHPVMSESSAEDSNSTMRDYYDV